MQVTLHRTTKNNPEKIEEIEGVMAASDAFPYWVLRYEPNEEGQVRVRFLAVDTVDEVDMLGDPEQQERNLATVTPIRPDIGGDDFGAVS